MQTRLAHCVDSDDDDDDDVTDGILLFLGKTQEGTVKSVINILDMKKKLEIIIKKK